MSAQADLNALTGTILGGAGSALSIGKGIDSAMAKKAKEALKQKLAMKKQISKQISNRMGKIGGNE